MNTTTAVRSAYDSEVLIPASEVDELASSHYSQFSFRVRVAQMIETLAQSKYGEGIESYTSSSCDYKLDAKILSYPRPMYLDGVYEERLVLQLYPSQSHFSNHVDSKALKDLELEFWYTPVSNSSSFGGVTNLCDLTFGDANCSTSLFEAAWTNAIRGYLNVSNVGWSGHVGSEMATSTFQGLRRSDYSLVDNYFILRDPSTITSGVDDETGGQSWTEGGSAVELIKGQPGLSAFLPAPSDYADTEPTWFHLEAQILFKDGIDGASQRSSNVCWTGLFSWGGLINSESDPSTFFIFNVSNTTSSNVNFQHRRLTREHESVFAFRSPKSDMQSNVPSAFAERKEGEDIDFAFYNFLMSMESVAFEGAHSYHEKGMGQRRRLEDTYASSLLYVNRLLNNEFGPENRKVPAHMPHLIDIDTMNEMQHRWQHLWDETSSHRFRSPRDMQYAFAYYYYVVHRYEATPPDLAAFLHAEVDTNQDGFIDDNEFRTIAAMVRGKILTPDKIKEYRDCAFPVIRVNSTIRREKFGEIEETRVIKALPTVENVLNCSVIREALMKRTKDGSNYQIVPPSHVVADEFDVSFEMLYDNVTLTEEKLDSIRWRRTKVYKIVCKTIALSIS